jgi:hypothetical protein
MLPRILLHAAATRVPRTPATPAGGAILSPNLPLARDFAAVRRCPFRLQALRNYRPLAAVRFTMTELAAPAYLFRTERTPLAGQLLPHLKCVRKPRR